MKDSDRLLLKYLIKLIRSSEKKFKQGNFKGGIDDKIKAHAILKSESCDQKIIEKYLSALLKAFIAPL